MGELLSHPGGEHDSEVSAFALPSAGLRLTTWPIWRRCVLLAPVGARNKAAGYVRVRPVWNRLWTIKADDAL